MNTRAKKIVYDAWEITKNGKELLKFGFWPSFFGILVGSAYVFYQIDAFMRSQLFHSGSLINFSQLINTFSAFIQKEPDLFIAAIVLLIIVLIGYFFVPIICSGALVHLIAKIHQGEEASHGLTVGLFRFLPLFEMSAVKSTVKPISFFTEWSFVIRNLGPGQAMLVTPVLGFLVFVGIIILFLFTLTTQLIVIEKADFGRSIASSVKLVISNIGTTFSLFLIIILIELRVILNVAVILFIPIAALWITGIFATIFNALGIALAIAVALILVSLTAYITGTLSVFSHAIWTLAYWDFKEKSANMEIKVD